MKDKDRRLSVCVHVQAVHVHPDTVYIYIFWGTSAPKIWPGLHYCAAPCKCSLFFTSFPFLACTALVWLDRWGGWEVVVDPGACTQVDQSQFQTCQWKQCRQLPVTAWAEQPHSSSRLYLCVLPSGNRLSHAPGMLHQPPSAHIYHYFYITIIIMIIIIKPVQCSELIQSATLPQKHDRYQ